MTQPRNEFNKNKILCRQFIISNIKNVSDRYNVDEAVTLRKLLDLSLLGYTLVIIVRHVR